MAEFNLESIIRKGVETALNKPVHDGKTITEWAAIGMKTPRWISVKDRLPEYTGWYLTYHHKINLCVVSWFTGDGWEDGDWGAYEDGWVSHWMPLPEDPKEVKRDG